MIPVFRRDLVEEKKWLSEEEFLNILSIAQAVPGPITTNAAIWTGRKLAGRAGAAAAVVGVVLGPFLVVVAAATVLAGHFQKGPVKAFLAGAGAATVGLIGYSVLQIGKRVVRGWVEGTIFIAAVLASLFFGLHPLVVIAAATAIGYIAMKGNDKGDVLSAG